MAAQPTCGQGLATNAALPAKLGDTAAALADLLETHTTALELDDENAVRERDAYLPLVDRLRRAAAELAATAADMTGHRDLPMARHDVAVLQSAQAAVFERFVAVERELLALVEERLERDRAMLGAPGRSS